MSVPKNYAYLHVAQRLPEQMRACYTHRDVHNDVKIDLGATVCTHVAARAYWHIKRPLTPRTRPYRPYDGHGCSGHAHEARGAANRCKLHHAARQPQARQPHALKWLERSAREPPNEPLLTAAFIRATMLAAATLEAVPATVGHELWLVRR